MQLWARCKGLNLKSIEFALVFGGGVLYELDVYHSDVVVEQLLKIQHVNVPVQIQLVTSPQDWTMETQGNYNELIGKLTKQLPNLEEMPWMKELQRIENVRLGETGDVFYGRCYDPNGWQWTCPALSQLHLYSWDMEDEYLYKIINEESEAAFRWACPGQLLKWKDNKVYLQHKQISELTNAAIVAAKDMGRKASMKELLFEAAKNERKV